MFGIDEAGLTPEQWHAVFAFATNNFGNVVNEATLALLLCRDGHLSRERIVEIEKTVREGYWAVVATMRMMMLEKTSKNEEPLDHGGHGED